MSPGQLRQHSIKSCAGPIWARSEVTQVIDVGAEFESGQLDQVVAALLAIPLPLRPQSFSSSETGRGESVDDAKTFAAFLRKSKSGFFLKRPGLVCSISIGGNKQPLTCNCFVELGADAARSVIEALAQARPRFASAASLEERDRRNRVSAKFGINNVEAWVGRDVARYVPGLYWLTLLPRTLSEAHGLSLEQLRAQAREHVALEGDQDLFRFYDDPGDWAANQERVAQLYRQNAGIFDVEKVKPLLSSAKNWLEFTGLVRQWD
jgi:hypothetical protein